MTATLQVEVQDISSSTVLFTLAGPGSDELMTKLGAGSLVDREEGSHAVFGAAGQPVVVSVAAELGVAGYSIVASEGIGGDLWQRIVGQVCGAHAWRRLPHQSHASPCNLSDKYGYFPACMCE